MSTLLFFLAHMAFSFEEGLKGCFRPSPSSLPLATLIVPLTERLCRDASAKPHNMREPDLADQRGYFAFEKASCSKTWIVTAAQLQESVWRASTSGVSICRTLPNHCVGI